MSSHLNALLQLLPLTLVEVADKRALREAHIGPAKDVYQCPYWFFQHVHADGRLVVASPGGGRENIDAVDVMNIIPTEPMRVMAMPRCIFESRLRDTSPTKYQRQVPEHYHPACVMGAQRDRWGGFNYHVWFDDPDFNVSGTYTAPLLDADRARIKPLTSRRTMPVSNFRSSANWSAGTKASQIADFHAKKAADFVAASLKGEQRKLAKLCSLDV